MSIEHNSNSFADYELSPWEISSTEPGAGTFSPLETVLGTGKTSNWNGLIAEPTNELFDKMWESVDGLTEPPTTTPTFSSAPIVPVEVKPLAANAFVRTQPLDELEASAVAHQKFLDLVRLTNVSPKTSQKNNSSENNNKTSVNNALTFDQLWEIQTRDLPPLVQKPKPAAPEAEAVPTIKTAPKVESAPKKDEAPLAEAEIERLLSLNVAPKRQQQQQTSEVVDPTDEKIIRLIEKHEQSIKKTKETKRIWTCSLISGITALLVGLAIFGQSMLPAYLVQNQVQQITGLSLRMKNVRQDNRAGITTADSIIAYDSAQSPFFETGAASFSSLPYFAGNNQSLKWVTIEGIRFSANPTSVHPYHFPTKDNAFTQALKGVEKNMDNSQIDYLVKNSVATISSPFEQTIRQVENEIKGITEQVKTIQDRQLSSGGEASDADKAQATVLQQQMQASVNRLNSAQDQYNQRNETLLNNLRQQQAAAQTAPSVATLNQGEFTQYLFGQDYSQFIGQFLYEIRQFCRWLPVDLEKALGPVDKLDPSALSFRRIATQEQIAVGQVRLSGQTQFMNQTVPFSAVISNYSTLPNGKPLIMNVAFGADQSSRLRIEARRADDQTEIKVEFAATQPSENSRFGSAQGVEVSVNSEESKQTVQTRSLRFIIADGTIKGEYAMMETSPSITISLQNVHSQAGENRLRELAQGIEKINISGIISGSFSKPNLQMLSNVDSWGQEILTVAANEYALRMDEYRSAIERKSEDAIAENKQQLVQQADNIRVNANGNALLLNQLSSGIVAKKAESQELLLTPPVVNEELPVVHEELPVVNDELPPVPEVPSNEAQQNNATDQNEVIILPDAAAEPEIPAMEQEVAPIVEEAPAAAPEDELTFPAIDDMPPLEDSNGFAVDNTQSNQAAAEEATPIPSDLPPLEDDIALPPMIEEPIISNDNNTGAQAEHPMEEAAPIDDTAVVTISIGSSKDVSKAPAELNNSNTEMTQLNPNFQDYHSPEMEFSDENTVMAAPEIELPPLESITPVETVAPAVPESNHSLRFPRRIPPKLPERID